MNDRFSAMHPWLSFLYFAFVLLISMFYLHPVFLLLSLLGAVLYTLQLKGLRSLLKQLCYLLPVMLISALINVAFNHRGATILCYLPGGNPLTLESLKYGLVAALMFGCILCWFRCLSTVLTSDKVIYLFGRVVPAIALLLSMTMRLLPRLKNKAKQIAEAQKGLGHGLTDGNLWTRLKNGLRIISILLTWALENAVDTADSMKARGYGLKKRTAFTLYSFHRADIIYCVILALLGMGTLLFFIFDTSQVSYFPRLYLPPFTPMAAISCFCFALICLFPVTVNLLEDLKWKYSQSKI